MHQVSLFPRAQELLTQIFLMAIVFKKVQGPAGWTKRKGALHLSDHLDGALMLYPR